MCVRARAGFRHVARANAQYTKRGDPIASIDLSELLLVADNASGGGAGGAVGKCCSHCTNDTRCRAWTLEGMTCHLGTTTGTVCEHLPASPHGPTAAVAMVAGPDRSMQAYPSTQLPGAPKLTSVSETFPWIPLPVLAIYP